MPRHAQRVVLPYTAEEIFDLVADVKDYPKFLPWCAAANIKRADNKQIIADLIIGLGIFRENFTSDVKLDRPHRITVRYIDGPMEYLHNQWVFVARNHETEVDFNIDFEFKSHLLGHVVSGLFHNACIEMVDAFERRAHVVYGPRGPGIARRTVQREPGRRVAS